MAGIRKFHITLFGKDPSGATVVDTEVFWHDDNALEIIKATAVAPVEQRADTLQMIILMVQFLQKNGKVDKFEAVRLGQP